MSKRKVDTVERLMVETAERGKNKKIIVIRNKLEENIKKQQKLEKSRQKLEKDLVNISKIPKIGKKMVSGTKEKRPKPKRRTAPKSKAISKKAGSKMSKKESAEKGTAFFSRVRRKQKLPGKK